MMRILKSPIKDTAETTYYKLYRVWDTIRWFPYNLKMFFINLWRWRKELWYHRDWDAAFALQYLRKKLLYIADYMQQSDIAVGEQRWVWECKVAASLLDIVIEENKYLSHTGEHETIRPDKKGLYEWKPGTLFWKFDHYVNLRNASRYCDKHLLDCINEAEDYNKAIYLSEYYYRKAWNILWRWLDQYWKNWWD